MSTEEPQIQQQPVHPVADEHPREPSNGMRRREKRRTNRSMRGSISRLPASANIKVGLLVTSVAIVLGSLLYAHQLVTQLKQREYLVAKLFSDAFKYNANAVEPPDDSLYRMITKYVQSSEVPVIVTDNHDIPNVRHFDQTNWNVPYDSTLDSAHQVAYLREQMREMDQDYHPIAVFYHDPATGKDIIAQYVHYGNSLILGKIESLPFVQLLLGALVVFIGYLSFSYLKRSEQSNIWVGMAKETAHQLGTPLSSLLGWSELLRLSAESPEEVFKITGEIDRDIERLNRIAVRFSKIGSTPDLKPQNVVQIIADVMHYFEGRMPQLRKTTRLELDSDDDEIVLPLNRELFEWVMENLIKNAYESIERPDGLIKISIHHSHRGDGVVIDVADNGKGIESRKKNDVFRPGYSTKKRGWGLGLSLSRRIVQEYHHGRLIVRESSPGKGTTFRIRLRNNIPSA